MKSFLTILSISLAFILNGQNPWTEVSESQVMARHSLERLTVPDKYETYKLDVTEMKQLLSSAPLTEFSVANKKARMALPLADGTTEIFEFVESPAMSPVLAAKFPNIKSFKGQSISNSFNNAWIDYSPEGFRAAINMMDKIVYIDPYYESPTGEYIVYNVADHKVDTESMQRTCGVEAYEDNIENNNKLKPNPQTQLSQRGKGMPVIKHTYRFALTCTGWWGDQQGGTVDAVMAKMNSATNRLNSFFEPELASKFELIDNNDKLIFFTSNNAFMLPAPGEILDQDSGTHPGRQILGQCTQVINNNIGSNNYDVGHCFTLRCTDGIGGVAALGSACQNSKGQGLSCVGNSNIDNFMTSTTAHEIGHQFTAGHTWNSCPGSEGQFSFESNCEPGSGSTIMSYFGSCGSDNLSGVEFPYYHVCSLDPIYDFVSRPGGAGGNCGSHIPNANSLPDVWIEQAGGFYIPISTPFELTGDASDMDGDELLYNWDQTDHDFSVPLGSPAGNSASFRSLRPSTNKTRIFPNLANVLSGRDNEEERLPTYSRDLSFAFIARDGNLDAGGVNWAGIEFKATDEAGPFRVNKPSQFTTTEVGEYIDVEWFVANTDGELVDCQVVDIYFSADGGLTFPHKLLTTNNDGAATVRIPNVLPTDNGKIKVKGHKNIFFNISRNFIRVNEATTPGYFLTPLQTSFEVCLPNSLEAEIASSTFLDFSGDITLDIVSGLPDMATYEFAQNPLPAGSTTTLNVDMTEVLVSDNYEVVIRGISGVDTVFQTITVDAIAAYLGDVALSGPNDDSRGLGSIPNFEWEDSPNVSRYRLQVATNPSFEEQYTIVDKDVGKVTSATDLVDLDNSTVYYWRLIMTNDCLGDIPTDIFTFSSKSLSCRTFVADDLPTTISSNGKPTIETTLDVTDQGEVSDINVELIKGNHNDLKTLRATLISPATTEAILWQGECLNTGNINAGFDSESAFANGCPDRNGEKMQSRESLSIFDGESIEGKWTLKIEDVAVGNGGTLTDFELELCSTSALFSPFLVNNEVLEVRTSKGLEIRTADLLSDDENNSSSELKYTIVVAPSKGTLYRNGNPITVGSTFTQANINSSFLRYKHEGTVDEQDHFTFVVEDGEGGWVEKTNFLINMSENGQTSNSEIQEADEYFSIYPNPASDLINLSQIEKDGSELTVEILSADGSLVKSQSFINSTVLNVAPYQSGLYILNITDGVKVYSKKISIVK